MSDNQTNHDQPNLNSPENMMSEIFRRLGAGERERADQAIELAVVKTQFLAEVRAINTSVQLLATGKAPGCLAHDAEIAAIKLAHTQLIDDIKARADIREVAAVDAKIDKVYITWSWIWKTFLGAIIIAVAAAAYERWKNGAP